MKLKKILLVALGCLSLVLGCVGIVLPILPTVPFFLLTLYCFARSSQRLHDWFVGTALYRNHLESYVKKQGMTARTKGSIIATVTLLMGFGFYMMKSTTVGRVILAVVWAAHLIYFLFFVKTIPAQGKSEP